MKKYIFTVVLFLAVVLNAAAATDGTAGATSTGTVNVTLTINPVMKISNLNDITFTYTGATGNLIASDDICIYSNNLLSSNYYITATSGHASSGTFRVSNGGGTPAYIPYTLEWFTQISAGGTATSLSSGVKNATAFTGANSTSDTCSGGLNSSIKVTFAQSDLTSAASGSYTDTITLLLSAS